MVAKRNFVIEHLNGNPDFDISDDLNFPQTPDWQSLINSLQVSQQNLIDSISKFPTDRLKEKVGNRSYSYRAMIQGIVHHDLYHLGQIALLNR
jgi:hypothetical protein